MLSKSSALVCGNFEEIAFSRLRMIKYSAPRIVAFPRARMALPDSSPKPGIVLREEVELVTIDEEPDIERVVGTEVEEKDCIAGHPVL